MRILHVLETLSPRYGGPVTVLTSLAAAQHRAGHEVRIVSTNADYPRGVYREPGWDVIPDSDVEVLYASTQFEPLRFSTALARYLRSSVSQHDIVHVHGLYRFPPTYAAREARRQGVPYIIRPFGSLDPFLHDKSTERKVWLKRLYERWFDLPNLHAAGAIHYTTEEERNRASFLGLRSESFVVPNGVDWARFETLPARGALRARLGLGDAPVVLFLGRIHFKKGLDLLIPAFDAVRRMLPDARLVIAGPDNDGYGSQVRSWVQSRGLEPSVHFVESLHGTDVIQAYVDADVFALPSYTENFGVSVVEAMACRLPVVISDQVNIHGEVAAVGAGVVTTCDADEFGGALTTLLSEPEQRHTMGEAGRELVHTKYAWPSIVDLLTQEYEVVVQRSGGAAGRSGQGRRR